MAASPGKHPERQGVTVQLARAGRNNPLFRGAARARPTALWKDSSPRAALRRKSGGGGRQSTTVKIFFSPASCARGDHKETHRSIAKASWDIVGKFHSRSRAAWLSTARLRRPLSELVPDVHKNVLSSATISLSCTTVRIPSDF